MEMHAVDIDHVGGFAKCLIDIPVFEDPVPDTIRARFFVQDAFVGQRAFRIDHRIQCLVFDLHQFGGIVGQAWRFSN